jgi:arylsulfatase A-like enzyme
MENPTATSDPNVVDATGAQPNIIMVMVDQMRFPMHLPPGIPDADRFIEKYMPNLFKFIWSKGVRFSNYYIAASDCTAGRATVYTGLYAYQTYLMLTLITFPEQPDAEEESGQQGLLQPQLQPAFPTVGHLLRDAGYDTPYFGKWHMSYHVEDLERYGFESHVQAGDLPGLYGQGLKYDNGIAEDAAAWVNERVEAGNAKPFFLSVNFVNPHDKQFFWGGMQVEKFNKIYKTLSEKPAQPYEHEVVPEGAPPSYGYPADVREFLNWESKTQLDEKPGTQTLVKEVFQYQMGGIYQEDEAATYTPVRELEPESFWTAPTNLQPGKHKAVAAYEYWSKALDSYIQVQQMVDEAFGTFMERLPAEVINNSVFVFTSDHGEYASSHGLQGKGGTIYEEGILIPLVVYDPTGRFTGSAEQYRTQLISSVDLLPMIITMAHGGADGWMRENEDYAQLYGTRCDLLSILRDADAPGRQSALHTTDEFLPAQVNYLDPPAAMHVIGTIFKDEEGNKQKLGIYTTWESLAEAPSQAVLKLKDATTEIEYYDHGTEGGAKELENTPDSQKAQEAISRYWGASLEGPSPVLDELQATLPPAYREAQLKAYRRLQAYMKALNEASQPAEPGQSDQPDIGVRDEFRERVARTWAF